MCIRDSLNAMKPSDMSNVDRIAIEMGHAGRNAIAYIDEDRNSDRPFKLQTYRPCLLYTSVRC